MMATTHAPGLWRSTWLIARLELQQRLRSRTLWVLAIVWFAIIGAVTGVAWWFLKTNAAAYGNDADAYPLFSAIVFLVLLLGSLVAPAISAGSLSSERIGGTLATTQVTLVRTAPILLGKALAAWLTGLAFLVVAAPFVIFSLTVSNFQPLQLLLAFGALALQLGLFTAMGVGISALITSPLFAIVTAYLLIALLSIGTLIGFAVASVVVTRYVDVDMRIESSEYYAQVDECVRTWDGDGDGYFECSEEVPSDCVVQTQTLSHTETDRIWWILAMNPYVMVGDLVSVRAGDRVTTDLFGSISLTVRTLQHSPEPTPEAYDDCGSDRADFEPIEEQLTGTIPVWWVGLLLQLMITGGLLAAGAKRLRTPAAKLPKGSRIA